MSSQSKKCVALFKSKGFSNKSDINWSIFWLGFGSIVLEQTQKIVNSRISQALTLVILIIGEIIIQPEI